MRDATRGVGGVAAGASAVAAQHGAVRPYWAQAATLTTLEACETALRENTQRLLQVVETLAAADLSQTAVAPWGKTYTLAEGCMLHHWNLTYHLGQVAYIQLLYGDTEYH